MMEIMGVPLYGWALLTGISGLFWWMVIVTWWKTLGGG
jgi:hypothetical protein